MCSSWKWTVKKKPTTASVITTQHAVMALYQCFTILHMDGSSAPALRLIMYLFDKEEEEGEVLGDPVC